MIKAILFILLFLVVVLGLCEILYILRMFFYFPGIRNNYYLIINLKHNYALKQLNFIWQKIKWYGVDFASGIIAITDNLEQSEIVRCNDFIVGKNIVLCESKTLSQCKYLQGDF